jgi:AAA domain-containing protein/TIR domain-containing protein
MPPPIPELPARVQAVLDRALQKHPKDRYQSSLELAVDFSRSIGLVAEPVQIQEPFETTRSFEKLLLDNSQELLLEHRIDTTESKDGKGQKIESAKIFICYKRSAKDDHALAEYLNNHLTKEGHHVFIDTSMRVGVQWLKDIDENIRTSDYLIVLVSKDSADSEMVQAEILRAYEYRNKNGRPRTLPVRINYEGMLPYTISAFIGQIQRINWNGIGDNEQVADEIANVIRGEESLFPVGHQKAYKITSFSEDGRPIFSSADKPHPLPSFDPRILDELEEPGGSLKLEDKFYIERESDEKLKRHIAKNGTTITIRASRQTGKSSLLVRGMHHVHSSANVVYLDLQSIEHSAFDSADGFLRYFAGAIARKLKLDAAMVSQIWRDKLGPQDKLVKVMEEYILPRSDRQIVLAIDEADRLLSVPFHSDFFALLRSWHNNRAVDPQWNKLNIAMVIATEPYLLISNPSQSPFNVGIKLNLEDFSRDQVRELNHRHGDPVQEKNLEPFFELLNGHPYLTRKALYLLISENLTWENLYQHAADDQGPFADNLRRQLWFIQEDDVLQSVLRQVLYQNKSDDDKTLWRLLRAGLIKGTGDRYQCRCGLYEKYFREHLK